MFSISNKHPVITWIHDDFIIQCKYCGGEVDDYFYICTVLHVYNAVKATRLPLPIELVASIMNFLPYDNIFPHNSIAYLNWCASCGLFSYHNMEGYSYVVSSFVLDDTVYEGAIVVPPEKMADCARLYLTGRLKLNTHTCRDGFQT